MSVKIFCIYHKASRLFESEIFAPIQTGCDGAKFDLGILKDNTGDNISKFNKNFGELSAWFWVWRNYLPAHPEAEYIGFAHYRRFMDIFGADAGAARPQKDIALKKFEKIFESWRGGTPDFKGADILLSNRFTFKNTVLEQYVGAGHSVADYELLAEIVREKYPEYYPYVGEYFSGHGGYFCLNFVMRRELFDAYMKWAFDILFELQRRSDWSGFDGDYAKIRVPAYLIERFFNVWLMYQQAQKNIKIANKKCYLLKRDPTFGERLLKPFVKFIPSRKFRHAFRDGFNL